MNKAILLVGTYFLSSLKNATAKSMGFHGPRLSYHRLPLASYWQPSAILLSGQGLSLLPVDEVRASCIAKSSASTSLDDSKMGKLQDIQHTLGTKLEVCPHTELSGEQASAKASIDRDSGVT
jgi:hypothetical protein